MYLKQFVMMNVGPHEKLAVAMPFDDQGAPKPLVLVGVNGSGKTNVLSSIADAMMEVAALGFEDVLPVKQNGHKYYKISGGLVRRQQAAFSVEAFRFDHAGKPLYVRCAEGDVPWKTLTSDLAFMGSLNAQQSAQEGKVAHAEVALVRSVFPGGAYVFFPASRHEVPYWMNTSFAEEKADFSFPIVGMLNKPMVMAQGIDALKPWLVDVLMDCSVDVGTMVTRNQEQINEHILDRLRFLPTLRHFNGILQKILRRDDARIVRTNRSFSDQRLHVEYEQKVGVPRLNSLSAGQGTLLAIFGNILRFGNLDDVLREPAQMEGIVLVDEIDAHLHADLQFEALPKLMRMFPKVQFIVTCHSPLLPLGMRKEFGDDGFTLMEMPAGHVMGCERYSDFQRSFEMYQQTRTFEERVHAELLTLHKPRVVCEGKTDVMYWRAACEAFGMTEMLEKIDFMAVEDLGTDKVAGKDRLHNMEKILRNYQDVMAGKVFCVFDCDEKNSKHYDGKKLFVRVLQQIEGRKRKRGIENLLPNAWIREEFISEIKKEAEDGSEIIKKELNKVKLAEAVCAAKNPADFADFKPYLDDMHMCLVKQVKG